MSIVKINFRTILTTRLLLECKEKLLFLEQTPCNGGGLTLPGGRVENEEFAKEALIREAFEEVGISLVKKSLQLVHVAHRRAENLSEIILFFHCTADDSHEPIVKEPHKFQNAVWLPTHELPEELAGVIKKSLRFIKKGKFFSEFPKVRTLDIEPIIEASELEIEQENMELA